MEKEIDKENRGLLQWDPKGTCIFDKWDNPQSRCLFDQWSIEHTYFTALGYLVILLMFIQFNGTDKLTLPWAIGLLIITNLLHIIEEWLGNTSPLSIEALLADYIYPLFEPKHKPTYKITDNDYLQNSIGDILCGIIGSSIVFAYWYFTGKYPLFLFWFLIPIFMHVYTLI